jgi:hypothetical protein
MSNATDGGPLRTSRSIQEFQIDFFLEEEFNADPMFAKQFVAACQPTLRFASVEKVTHSVSDKYGEADLVVIVNGNQPSGEIARLALLIEDKITAGFQPDQAGRYRARGVEGKEQGLWTCFKTVLVAPSAYIARGHGFDAALSLEQTKEWICPADLARRRFKIAKIEEAIAKKNATGVQIVDLEMTSFRSDYYACLQEFNTRESTDFTMRRPAPTYWGDYWFILRSAELPNSAQIRHMPPSGIIELNLKDTDISKARALEALLEHDMKLVATGKYNQHTTIRCASPKISVFNDFARDQPKVEAALLAAKRLWQLVRRERVRIDEILTHAQGG